MYRCVGEGLGVFDAAGVEAPEVFLVRGEDVVEGKAVGIMGWRSRLRAP